MSGENPNLPRFDSIIAPSKEPYPVSETYTSHEDKEVKKAERRHRLTTVLGVTAVTLSTLIAAPRSWIVEPFLQLAGSTGEKDDEMSTFVSDLAGTSLRVECSNETLSRIDENDPLVEQGINYSRVGSTRTITLPGTDTTYAFPVIILRDEVCEGIDTYNETSVTMEDYTNKTTIDSLWSYTDSLSTVLHEVEHTQQIIDEAEATCLSFQKLPGVLVDNGFEPVLAEYLSSEMVNFKETQYLSEYFSDECRPGGAYDLGISDIYFGQEK